MDMEKHEVILYVEIVATGERVPIILAKTESLDEAGEMVDKIHEILPTAYLAIY